MDDVDRKLLSLMWENPRMSLREISKRLGTSRQSAHRRLKSFDDIGVFRNLRACVAGDYLDEFAVAIWGQSDSSSIEGCLDGLGKSRFTWRVEVLGGNFLVVMAGLTEMTDLDRYVKFVRTAAEMREPTVGIMCYDNGMNPYDKEKKKSYKELSPLDLEIVGSLQENARKPVSDIARELGVSAKTIRRHLDEMISDGSMVFNQPFDLTSGEDTLTFLYVKLRNGADKTIAAKRLFAINPVRFYYLRSFSNIPDLLIGLVSSEKTSEIRETLHKIAQDEDVLTVTPNLVYDERMYWNQDPMPVEVTNRSSKRFQKSRARA